jgi:hypothetical protein
VWRAQIPGIAGAVAYTGFVPDSYGKRARRDANAKKQAARQARREERAQRNRDREAGLIEKGVPIGPAEQAEFLPDAEELAQMEKEISGSE